MTPPDWAIRTKADTLAIDQGCYWDQAHADRILKFAESVFRPQYVAGRFQLLPWQARFLQSLYGWRLPNGHRRFRFANLHVSKKNGKTLLVSLISAFELVASGVPSSFVVTGSVSKDNAGQVFSELRHTLTKAGLAPFCKITPNLKRVTVPSLNAEYRSLASDGDRVQGYNASLVVLDEAHAMKSAGLYDSLRYATAARPDGLTVVISTAGDDVTQFYHAIYTKSKNVMSGDDLDITHYAEVYESDPDADPWDEREWEKANPSIDTSFTRDQFRLDLEAAKRDPSEWLRVLRYRLNRWCRPDDNSYFDVTVWDKHKDHVSEDELRRCECWLGVDLSQTVDPSSVSAVWHLGDRKFFVKSWAWVAREGVKLRESTSLPRYQQFAAGGSMTITAGDRIDDKLITAHILDLTKRHRVKAIVFDPTSAFVLMGIIEAEAGVEVLRMPQTHRYYTGPMKELHKAIVEGRVSHDGGDWLRYCLSCVRVDEDRLGNIRPHARRSTDHIDGAVAALMAWSVAAQQAGSGQPRRSVYDGRGILSM